MMRELSAEDRATYEWQMWVAGFGEAGQRRLKNSRVLVTRVGGVGGTVAYLLAAAGVGKLILAHAGNVKPSDLNRQLLMTHDWLGKPRVESARLRLRELNPHLEVDVANANLHGGNVSDLLAQADLAVGCAPLFEERLCLNREAVRQRKPLVDCAMFEFEGQLTTVFPGQSACLECVYPEIPPAWKRQFPVFGAVASTVGAMGALEAIKVLAKLGQPLAGKMLTFDLADTRFATMALRRRANCLACAGVEPAMGEGADRE